MPSCTARRRWVLAAVLAVAAACGDGAPDDAPPTANPALPGLTADAALTARLGGEASARGAAYRPRTRHLDAKGRPRFTNRLILESSPYLLQHAHNPVSWFAWSEAAFERARLENKPVFLSIGYSTCHWCHVMEHESFEDEEIARVLNERFVAVKVDREERPDVDNLYMTAVQLLRGNGGWPMTLVLTPEAEPFFAATYIPARDGDRGAPQGLLGVLAELADAYARDREAVVARAREVSGRVAEALRAPMPAGVPGAPALDAAAAQLASRFDRERGGFGRAPKFPQPSLLQMLLRHHARTGSPASLQMVTGTLEAMAAGGIRDHVGGGFHRYATDAAWRIPHFEKMLYDNAQLAVVYLEAYQASGREDFADVAREILYYVAREMTSPQGAFYSAIDADSASPQGHAEEGRFFTWTRAETAEVLGQEESAAFDAAYGVTEAGNLEGRSVLARMTPATDPEAEQQLARSRARLYLARARRSPPMLDDKIVASWNGLMISAMARGGFILDDSEYLERAARAAEFVLASMRDSRGRLARVFAAGRARHAAVLDDYAFVVQGMLDLFEHGGEARWLREAVALQKALEESYADPAGGYFLVAGDSEKLLARSKPGHDGAEPSGNSVAALNLLRLAELTQDPAHEAAAARVLEAFGATLTASPLALPAMLTALDFRLGPVREVVVVSPGDSAQAASLLEVLRRAFLPRRVFALVWRGGASAETAALIPLVGDKTAIDARATAYVCERGTCQRPALDAALLASQLGAAPAE